MLTTPLYLFSDQRSGLDRQGLRRARHEDREIPPVGANIVRPPEPWRSTGVEKQGARRHPPSDRIRIRAATGCP